jgi:hypothetical protein
LYEVSATAIYIGLFPRNIPKRVQEMKLLVTSCGVVGEVRTVYYPNSYLGPANVEMTLLSDEHAIITAFLVFFFSGFERTIAVFAFSCVSLRNKINFGLKTGNFKEKIKTEL